MKKIVEKAKVEHSRKSVRFSDQNDSVADKEILSLSKPESAGAISADSSITASDNADAVIHARIHQ